MGTNPNHKHRPKTKEKWDKKTILKRWLEKYMPSKHKRKKRKC